MGRFIGLSRNKSLGGAAIEDASAENTGLILTSNGTSYVAAGGASIDSTSYPDYLNANEAISTLLTALSAFSNSSFEYAWRNGSQYGLGLTSNGTLSGTMVSPLAVSVLNLTVTDVTYNAEYEVDLTLNVSLTNSYPVLTTNPTEAVSTENTVQFAASGSPTRWAILNRGNLPSDATINNSGLLTFPSAVSDGSTINYTFTIGFGNAAMPAGTYRSAGIAKAITFLVVSGQQQYVGAYGQNGGTCTFTWTAPAGVTKVHVMAMGGGGGGYYNWASCGGHGGGMVWANNIPVTPGNNYTVQVGRGGCWSSEQGGCSCWPGMVACGGCCGCYGGCFSFPGSVNGGAGSCCGGYGMVAYPGTAGGGGGGPGYCSAAPANSNTPNYCGCGGGGGSATNHHSSTYGTGGGGGTGACGMCCYGSFGTCGNAGYSHQTGSGGGGGSGGGCGRPGEPWSNGQGNGYSCGGCFAGGGGGSGTSHGGGWGGPGVVRILWGNNRCWPCCNTHNL